MNLSCLTECIHCEIVEGYGVENWALNYAGVRLIGRPLEGPQLYGVVNRVIGESAVVRCTNNYIHHKGARVAPVLAAEPGDARSS